MKIKQIISIVTIIAMLVLFGAGCKDNNNLPEASANTTTTENEKTQEQEQESEAAAEPVDITYYYWGTKDGISSTNEIAKQFNESQDKIRVEASGVDASVYREKLNAFFASNTAPDVIQVAADYGDVFIKKGLFEPLDPFFADDPEFKDKWPKTIIDALSIDDTLYSLPIGTGAFFIAYNKDLFDAAGLGYPTDDWTEAEFMELAKKMTDPEKEKYGFLANYYPVMLALGMYDNPVYDTDAKVMTAEGNEQLKDGIQFMIMDLFHNEKVAPVTLNAADIGGGFETGNYPMAIIATWDLAYLPAVIGDSFSWDIVRFPVNEKYDVRWKCPLFLSGLSIYTGSDKKDACFEFCKWWSTEELPQKSRTDTFPTSNAILNDPDFYNEFAVGPGYNKHVVIDTVVEQGISWWNAGVIGEINDTVITPEISALVLMPDEVNLDDVIARIQENGQAIFDKN